MLPSECLITKALLVYYFSCRFSLTKMFLLPLYPAQSDDENLRDEDLGQQEEKKSVESKDKTDKVLSSLQVYVTFVQ